MSELKKIKILGSGMGGTAYLVKLNTKKYVLKTQKILPSNIKESFKYELWREIDFYKYINKIPKKESIFFMKLIDYRIYDNCKEQLTNTQQEWLKDEKGKHKHKLQKLYKSTWCVDQLLEYTGPTLREFLRKHTLTNKKIYSFIIQFCIIGKILQKGGYAHNDLFASNMTVNKTNEKYFYYKKLKIPTYGYLLTVIDYGEVQNNKYKHNFKDFRKYPKEYVMRHDVFYHILDMIYDGPKLWAPEDDYTRLLNNILDNHNNFWNEIKKKYIKLYPKTKIHYKNYEKNRKFYRKKFGEPPFQQHTDIYYRIALEMMNFEFRLEYSKKYSKYLKFPKYYSFRLPKKEVKDIFKAKNLNYLIRYSSEKITNCLEDKFILSGGVLRVDGDSLYF